MIKLKSHIIFRKEDPNNYYCKYFLFIFFFYMCSVSSAQNAIKEIPEYVVNASKTSFLFYPNDTFLFSGSYRNKIKITTKGVGKKFEIKINNGKVTQKSDSIFVIENVEPGTTMLSIIETNKSGKKKIVKNKQYAVFEYPKVMINGVKCDSFISKVLLAGGIVKVFAEIENSITFLKVLSFKMDIYNSKTGFSVDSSTTAKLTPKMRKYVASVNDGGLFYIKEIKYQYPNGTIKTIPMYRVFLVKDEFNPYIFGM